MGKRERFFSSLRFIAGFLVFMAAVHFILARVHREPYFSSAARDKIEEVQESLAGKVSVPSWMDKLIRPSEKKAPEEKPPAAKPRPKAVSVPPWVEKPAAVRPLPVKKGPRIAIVIDDWGYNMRNVELAGSIKYPLTFAVLPNVRYSASVAQAFHERGQEVILHLPMEARGNLAEEENTLLIAHDEATIRMIIKDALASVVHAQGVSNHTGSRATEDEGVMRKVMSELKKRGLYFLDSYVTLESRGIEVAESLGVPCVKRDVFLDNTDEPAYIKNQMMKLKERAAREGQAVGIGHDRRNTVEVLQQLMPEMEKEGYTFVFVSDLL